MESATRQEKGIHISYLVRFWRCGAGADSAWRVLVRDVHGEGRWSFPSADALFGFLRQELERLDAEMDAPASESGPPGPKAEGVQKGGDA